MLVACEGSSAQETYEIEIASLDGDGITLTSSAGGEKVFFGAPREEIMPAAEVSFGAPQGESACAESDATAVNFADSTFRMIFENGRFVGYHSVQTTDDFLSMRRTWYSEEPNFTVGEATDEGVPFSFGEEGAQIRGLFADDSRDALVLWMAAGQTCSAI